jgi:hypothetical protein
MRYDEGADLLSIQHLALSLPRLQLAAHLASARTVQYMIVRSGEIPINDCREVVENALQALSASLLRTASNHSRRDDLRAGA